jgi:cytochrome c
MTDNRNTIFGWILFSGIMALGLSILSSKYFHADKAEHMEEGKAGFFIAGGEEEAGGAAQMTMAEALTMPGVDVAAGEKVFAKCSACHTATQGGANGIGPNLWGVMGQPIGKHAAGFAYSSALSGKGGNWDWDTMNAWLKSPAAFAKGTKMSFAGLSKIEDRAAISLYLNSLGSNLPVPTFVADAAEGAEGEAAAPAEGEAAPADAAAAPAAEGAAPAPAPAQ